MTREQEARQAILERLTEHLTAGTTASVDEAVIIASAHGIYPPEPFAEETMREGLLIYLGVAWGVGPRARWRDRLAVNARLLLDRVRRARA